MANSTPLNWGFLFLLWASVVWAWRTIHLLKALKHMPIIDPTGKPPDARDRVSIIIPMKNEETNALACYQALRAQDYPNLEILIANDNSSDRTEEILKSAGARYLNVPKTPDGWTGKNFALHHAVKQATGDWLLFSDADTRHETTSVSASLAYMKKRNLQFLSLLPRCLTGGFLEDLIQPPAMAMTGLWFPIQRINDPSDPFYFANGQYLFIHRKLYEALGGHEAVRGAFLEDFALMEAAKKARARAECALGRDVYGTRMYDNWGAIWRGWRRIYLHAFRRNPLVLMQRALAVLFFSFFPFVALAWFAWTRNPLFWFALALCGYIIGVSWRGYKIVRANRFYAFLHPFGCGVIVLILLDACGLAITKGKTVWR